MKRLPNPNKANLSKERMLQGLGFYLQELLCIKLKYDKICIQYTEYNFKLF